MGDAADGSEGSGHYLGEAALEYAASSHFSEFACVFLDLFPGQARFFVITGFFKDPGPKQVLIPVIRMMRLPGSEVFRICLRFFQIFQCRFIVTLCWHVSNGSERIHYEYDETSFINDKK